MGSNNESCHRCQIKLKNVDESGVRLVVTMYTYNNTDELIQGDNPLVSNKYLVTINGYEKSGISIYKVSKADESLIGLVKSIMKYKLLSMRLKKEKEINLTNYMIVDSCIIEA